MVRLKYLHIHPGLIIKAVHISLGNDLHQILIAFVIFRKKHQMVIPVLAMDIFPVKPGTRGHVDLTA